MKEEAESDDQAVSASSRVPQPVKVQSVEPQSVEPWLRGTYSEIPAVARAVVHALELAAEDAERWTANLNDEEINRQQMGLPSVGWQMRHIVRSVDRLLSYAEGRQLSEEQLRALRSESEPGTADALRLELKAGLDDGRLRVLALVHDDPEAVRGVGRKNLPTTVGGLLVHVADHTQRHTGQLVTTSKLILGQRGALQGTQHGVSR